MSVPPRLLLDTHVVLWWLADNSALSNAIKTMIDEEVDVFVSAVSVWEVAIEQAIGKIESPADLPEIVRDRELQQLAIPQVRRCRPESLSTRLLSGPGAEPTRRATL